MFGAVIPQFIFSHGLKLNMVVYIMPGGGSDALDQELAAGRPYIW